MNKEGFLKQVRERLGQFLPPEYRSAEVVVREYDVLDEKRYGLALIKGEPERVPVVDLEEAFKEIQEGRSIDDVLNEVAEIYMQICNGEKQVETMVMDADDFFEGLHTLVLNFEKSKDVFKKVPYLKVNDLAVIPMIYMPNGNSVPVPLEVAECICKSGDYLLAKAMNNHAKLLPPVLIRMASPGLPGKDFIDLDNGKVLDEKDPVYILTNRDRVCGAAAIANKEILAMVSRKLGESFYIMPCSIHEVAVVPQSYSPSLTDLREAMRGVNRQSVKDGKFLSENIYFYDAQRSTVKMFDGKLHKEKVQARTNLDGR